MGRGALLATSRPVRIPRPVAAPEPAPSPVEPAPPSPPTEAPEPVRHERRVNQWASQRVVRISAVYLVALALLYVGFVVYDRSAPGGSSSPTENGILLLTLLFAAFSVVGILYTLTPAPRAIELVESGVVVVGRWGRRRALPPMGELSIRVVRRYPVGWLNNEAVELVEVWAPEIPVRGYLVDAGLFAGASASSR